MDVQEAYSEQGELVYHLQFIDVWMKYSVHEAYTRAFVRILVGKLDVDLPETTLKWCCNYQRFDPSPSIVQRTLFWALEPDVKLLPEVC